jgi:hypothetical protein
MKNKIKENKVPNAYKWWIELKYGDQHKLANKYYPDNNFFVIGSNVNMIEQIFIKEIYE